MTEKTFHNALLTGWLVLGAGAFASLFFVVAPYRRHSRGGWGPCIPDCWDRVAMEAPGASGLVLLFLLRPRPAGPLDWVFLTLWEGHYLYRAFLYPLRRRSAGKLMP